MNKILTTAAVAFGLVAIATQASAASKAQYCGKQADDAVFAATHPVGKAAVGCVAGGILANILSQGNAGATAGGCVAGGATVLVLTAPERQRIRDDAFNRCMYGSTQPAYVQPSYQQPVVQPIATFPPPSGSAAVYSSLNVRNGPGPNYGKIFGLQPNTVVPVSACAVGTNGKNWCMVGIPGGSGWAAQDYLFFN